MNQVWESWGLVLCACLACEDVYPRYIDSAGQLRECAAALE